jgi:hypothetical protein
MSLAPVSPSTGPVSSPPPSPAVVLLGVFDTYSSTQTETTLIYLSGLPLRLVRAGLGALMRDGEVYSPETGKWTRIRPTPPTPSQPLPGSPKNPSSGILLYPPTNVVSPLAIPPTQLRSEVNLTVTAAPLRARLSVRCVGTTSMTYSSHVAGRPVPMIGVLGSAGQ